MIFFPEWLIALLIAGSLLLTGIGALSLLILLLRDFKNKSIW